MRPLLTLGGFLALVLAYLGAARGAGPGRRRLGRGGWTLLVLVGVPSLLQLFVAPQLLDVLGRRSELVVQQHQYWRLVTSIFVQDGGVVGTVVNLVLLVLTVPAAARVWGSAGTVAAFLGSGVVLNVSAVHFGVDGAGNSGATLALGTTLLLFALVRRRWGWVVLGLLGGVVLLLAGDEHWTAVVVGLVVGVVLTALVRRPARATASDRLR